MNETRFLVERAEKGRIDIRDRHTGLLFSFPISDRKLGPTIDDENHETAQMGARSFAEDEARKWGWIDPL
jgi:hypothetical protein